MTKKVALFDMDGTLCDYDGAMRHELSLLESSLEANVLGGADLSLHKLEDLPSYHRRMTLIKNQPGWWEELPELPLGFSILEECLEIGYHCHILTRGPSSCPAGWTEKMRWYKKHIHARWPKVGITITQDKGLVYGRVLVDDWPPYIKPWLKHRPRGLVLMPEQSWNAEYKHPQVVRVEGTLSPVQRLILQAAFDR